MTDLENTGYHPPCMKCGGLAGACSMRCTALSLAPGWYDRVEWSSVSNDDEYAAAWEEANYGDPD